MLCRAVVRIQKILETKLSYIMILNSDKLYYINIILYYGSYIKMLIRVNCL